MFARAGRILLDAVAPRRCAACDAVSAAPICTHCAEMLRASPVPPPCRLGSMTAFAAFEFAGVAREVLHRGKFQGDRPALEAIATLATSRVAGTPPPDAVVAVPLGRRRRRQRGYNQATVIASVLAPAVNAPVIHGLLRCRETAPQANRDEEGRRANIAGAFAWQGTPLLGATLWLIDDVLTTGATAESAAAVLRAAGARRVSAVVVARVP